MQLRFREFIASGAISRHLDTIVVLCPAKHSTQFGSEKAGGGPISRRLRGLTWRDPATDCPCRARTRHLCDSLTWAQERHLPQKMRLTQVLLKKAKAKNVLVFIESTVSGHRYTRVKERLADKVEAILYDPWVQKEVVYKEVKKVRSLK
ncbi:unnamed protein product [Darwinula stevensoni]|uniref:Large ribosomal subunit protein bL33m n=1 Tax=Darwinula stevensoni TaxID=69355 RepID=A0A7R8XGV4_9CRUS|nr:unnamed protein product [Darwinula stevensoni]CAG0891858.1 unnamed protein product [Darwinula stevensoni]